MKTTVNIEALQKDAVEMFHSGFACSEAIIWATDKHFELGMGRDAIAMSSGFPWGMGGAGCLCGAAAGAVMCLGYIFGRREPGDPRVIRCFSVCQDFHDAFRKANGATCCRVLMHGLEREDPKRKEGCTRIVENAARILAELIMEELALDPLEPSAIDK